MPRLKFSHLNEHKFCHSFRNSVKPICDCGADIETTKHFFLCCKLFACQLDDLYLIDPVILTNLGFFDMKKPGGGGAKSPFVMNPE